jgi:hypothetical protein
VGVFLFYGLRLKYGRKENRQRGDNRLLDYMLFFSPARQATRKKIGHFGDKSSAK